MRKREVNVKRRRKNVRSTRQCSNEIICHESDLGYNFNKEFDPGSGRTLAARLTHASRTEFIGACFIKLSGGRVSNT